METSRGGDMDLAAFTWRDHPANPLIAPRFPRWMIADPTVLCPHETPDGRWRLYANTIPPRLVEHVSDDGVHWRATRTLCPGAMRPYLRRIGGVYYLTYEDVTRWLPLRSRIVQRRSTDLVAWSEPRVLLEPCLPWHGRRARTCSNPCVVDTGREWWLVYSAGIVWLRDCLFVEPRYIGVARGPGPQGPFTPDPEPLIAPDPADPHRRLGAGALRLLPEAGPASAAGSLWGLTNGITRDDQGRSRSAVHLVRVGPEARAWAPAADAPLLTPEPQGWKRALVYALAARVTAPDELRVWYNARDGWFWGTERIGLAVGLPATGRAGRRPPPSPSPLSKGEGSPLAPAEPAA